MASDNYTRFDDLMENLSTAETEDLVEMADRTDYLFTLEPADLVYLIAELAGRLEDFMPQQVDFDEEDDEEHGTEYNA